MSARPGQAQASHRASILRPITCDELEWQLRALCRHEPVETFFPEKKFPHNTAAAKAICRDCPVSAECLQYALNRNERHGVWGGLNDKERRKLRRGRAGVA